MKILLSFFLCLMKYIKNENKIIYIIFSRLLYINGEKNIIHILKYDSTSCMPYIIMWRWWWAGGDRWVFDKMVCSDGTLLPGKMGKTIWILFLGINFHVLIRIGGNIGKDKPERSSLVGTRTGKWELESTL